MRAACSRTRPGGHSPHTQDGAVIAALTLSLAALTVITRKVLAKFVVPAYVYWPHRTTVALGMSWFCRDSLALATRIQRGALLLLSVLSC